MNPTTPPPQPNTEQSTAIGSFNRTTTKLGERSWLAFPRLS